MDPAASTIMPMTVILRREMKSPSEPNTKHTMPKTTPGMAVISEADAPASKSAPISWNTKLNA